MGHVSLDEKFPRLGGTWGHGPTRIPKPHPGKNVGKLATLNRSCLIALTATVASIAAAQDAVPQNVEKIDDKLTITWTHKNIRPKDGAAVFDRGVTAQYGQSTVRAEKITIFTTPTGIKEAIAEGKVELDDPDGKMWAERLQFNWIDETGTASVVTVRTTGLFLKADTLNISGDGWTLKQVYAAPDGGKTPVYGLRAPTLTIRPDGRGTAKPAILEIAGQRIARLPSYSFGGKRDASRIAVPSVSYNRGFGVSWAPRFDVDDRTLISGSTRARDGESSGLSVLVTRSLLPRKEPGSGLVPINDLAERFPFGYFDNVMNRKPADERASLSARRTSASLGIEFNETAAARLDEFAYSRPGFVLLENAGAYGNWGVYSSARWENVRQAQGPVRQRSNLTGAVLFPDVELGRNLRTHARVDAQGFFSGIRSGWTTAQFGLIYEPHPRFRIGAAQLVGKEWGKPMFVADRLFSTGGFLLRADANFGSTKLSYLTKWDRGQRKWYDNEITLSQAAGALEPYVGFREFPRTLTFGARLRVEEVFERLSKRRSPGK